jgi:hypothetical protein
MPFAKGESGNKAGKPKGTLGKTTQRARELITDAINDQSKDFKEVMIKLKAEDPREWTRTMVQLMKFVLPQKVDVTTDGESMNQPQAKIVLSNGNVLDLA